ncbi:MAG: hypothetical protein LBP92_07130 [Deltaproteobacteria bacterium]|nr:hypothetical protein [Deltaproteobacteria bacterium]
MDMIWARQGGKTRDGLGEDGPDSARTQKGLLLGPPALPAALGPTSLPGPGGARA